MIKHNCSSQSSFTNDKYCIWTIHSARRGMASGIDRQLRWQPVIYWFVDCRFGSVLRGQECSLPCTPELRSYVVQCTRPGRNNYSVGGRDMRPDHWSATLYCTWHLALYHWAIGAGLYWLSLARLFRIGALAELCSAEGDYKSIKTFRGGSKKGTDDKRKHIKFFLGPIKKCACSCELWWCFVL